MNTKTMKIIVTVLSAMIMVAMLGNIAFAATGTPLTPDTLGTKVDYTGTEEIGNIGGKIMGIIQTVGVVVAVVILMVLGVKYMMGSAEEKAEYKKTMIPYVIGAVLIFGASSIANMIFKFASAV